MVVTIIFAVLLIAAVVTLLALIVNAIRLWAKKAKRTQSSPKFVI